MEIDHNGVRLLGEILFRNKWAFTVSLIEPYNVWIGGCNIPTFARSEAQNRSFEGERGDDAVKNELIKIYERAKIFFSQVDRYQRIYNKDYLRELEAVKVIDNKKVRERIERKLKLFLINAIEKDFGDITTIWEEEWILTYLKQNSSSDN